jgi:hypothetical protein
MKKTQRKGRTISIKMDVENLYSLDSIAIDFNSQKIVGVSKEINKTPILKYKYKTIENTNTPIVINLKFLR